MLLRNSVLAVATDVRVHLDLCYTDSLDSYVCYHLSSFDMAFLFVFILICIEIIILIKSVEHQMAFRFIKLMLFKVSGMISKRIIGFSKKFSSFSCMQTSRYEFCVMAISG